MVYLAASKQLDSQSDSIVYVEFLYFQFTYWLTGKLGRPNRLVPQREPEPGFSPCMHYSGTLLDL